MNTKSFITNKSMKCYFCSKLVAITDEKFPEDLYDLIVQHEIDQLLWVCKGCKENTHSNLSHQLTFVSESQTKIEQKITDLTENIRLLNEEVKMHLAPSQRSTHLDENDLGHSNAAVGSSSSETDSVGYLNKSPGSNQPSPSNPKDDLNKRARSYMNDILNTLKVNDEEDANSRKIIKSFLEDVLLLSLKQNEAFNCLVNKPYYTGSAYNNLKITKANEFDINLVLQMPKQISLKPEFLNDTYAKLKWEISLTGQNSVPSPVSNFLKECSDGCYIQPTKVLSWLQRQVHFGLQTLSSSYPYGQVTKVESRESGPARTIIIYTDQETISVDLVPVFEFDSSALSETYQTALSQISQDSSKHNWFMVPKQCQGDVDMKKSSADLSWRLDFPNTEKCILHDKLCAKPIIKILKFLRDKKNWTPLASYYIKTVVLTKVMENPSKDYWSNSMSFERLLEVTDLLRNCVQNGMLPHFLTKQNLIYRFNEGLCKSISSSLIKFISSIKSNPEKLKLLL